VPRRYQTKYAVPALATALKPARHWGEAAAMEALNSHFLLGLDDRFRERGIRGTGSVLVDSSFEFV